MLLLSDENDVAECFRLSLGVEFDTSTRFFVSNELISGRDKDVFATVQTEHANMSVLSTISVLSFARVHTLGWQKRQF